MDNKYITKTVVADDFDGIEELGAAIRRGEVVAFPTETVYGLGADATNEEAVARIFEAKGRPSDNPLIVHIYDKSQIEKIASDITPLARKIIDNFMPGPITIILSRREGYIAPVVSAGLSTVGIRMPNNKTALEFLRRANVPVAAPSANVSGSPSPTCLRHVLNDMDGIIYGALDGGESSFGLESTVVDCTGEYPVILRPGAITKEMIDEVIFLGEEHTIIGDSTKAGEAPKAPGMKYRHYAPSCKTIIMEAPEGIFKQGKILPDDSKSDADEDVFENLSDDNKKLISELAFPYIIKVREHIEAKPFTRVGLFCSSEVYRVFLKLQDKLLLSHTSFYVFGDAYDVKAAAHSLFDGLRHLDLQDVDIILAQGFPLKDEGVAYMNRLKKASSEGAERPLSMKGDRREIVREVVDIYELPNMFTTSVLFLSDDDLTTGVLLEALLNTKLQKEGPFCGAMDTSLGAEIYVGSAGLYAQEGEAPDLFLIKSAKELLGLNLSYHKATYASASLLDEAELIIATDDIVARENENRFPHLKGKIHSISSYMASKGIVIKDEEGNIMSISFGASEENDERFVHVIKALSAIVDIIFPFILNDLGVEKL